MTNTQKSPEKEADTIQKRGETAMLAGMMKKVEKAKDPNDPTEQEIETNYDEMAQKRYAHSASGDQYIVHRVRPDRMRSIKELLVNELLENRRREEGRNLEADELSEIERDVVRVQKVFYEHPNDILSIESESRKGIEHKRERSKAGLHFMAKPDVLHGSITEQLKNLEFKSHEIPGGIEFIRGDMHLTFIEAKSEAGEEKIQEDEKVTSLESARKAKEEKTEKAQEKEKGEEERAKQIELAQEHLIKFFDKVDATDEFLEKYNGIVEFFNENPNHEYADKFYEQMNDFAKKTQKLIESTPAKMPSFQAEGGNIRQDIEDYLDQVWEDELGKDTEQFAA
ncbi:hypothetical protein KKC88_03390 [Patescibacteria group bacterium]|nr:hypothetical protein [Patescibacteria group bacterium]MBU1673836.1 hypothetical protein [Patescibacteria group bacterium]MBU1963607.1 hypothetical protein [Patescibacteria group bacterium]